MRSRPAELFRVHRVPTALSHKSLPELQLPAAQSALHAGEAVRQVDEAVAVVAPSSVSCLHRPSKVFTACLT